MADESKAAVPYPSSLCHRCRACRYVRTKTSTFIMCKATATKYPPQPVRRCPWFRMATEADQQG